MDYQIVNKSKKPLIIAFVILGIIIASLVGYIVVDIKFFHNKDEKSTLVVGDVDLDIGVFYNIEDTLNRFDYAFNKENSSHYGYIYKQNKLEAKDMSKTATIYSALRGNIINSKDVVIYIPENEVKRIFNNMYGKNAEYEPQNIPAGEKYIINYEGEQKRYAYIASDLTDTYQNGLIAVNTKTKVEEGTITITRKVFYVEYIIEKDGSVASAKIYGDLDKEKYVGKIAVNKKAPDPDEIIGKFGSKLLTYEFTFKENSKENIYNFYSIVKVK